LSDQGQTASLIPNVLKVFPGIDVLINNASIFELSALTPASLASLNRHFSVNFIAPYILTSQFAQKCKHGQIINMLDTHIVNNKTQYTTYLLSKKALCELTKMSALELAPDIRVNAIAPGLIFPPENTRPGYLQKLAEKIPLKKAGQAGQIAQSIEFLLNNPYVTGQVIFNDGGEHLI
jgi:NAD(P)-dependent dehydrogenase (short-subunit alcohol dehydrogenase family)